MNTDPTYRQPSQTTQGTVVFAGYYDGFDDSSAADVDLIATFNGLMRVRVAHGEADSGTRGAFQQ